MPYGVIARNVELLRRLDAAFFRVGEARGGALVKYHAGEPCASREDLRAGLERHGLEVRRLEREGRFAEDPGEERRSRVLRRLLEGEEGRPVWVGFDWTGWVGVEEALSQQEEITGLVRETALVVKTAVLEDAAGPSWTSESRRGAQEAHSGTIRLSEGGPGPQPGDAAAPGLSRASVPAAGAGDDSGRAEVVHITFLGVHREAGLHHLFLGAALHVFEGAGDRTQLVRLPLEEDRVVLPVEAPEAVFGRRLG